MSLLILVPILIGVGVSSQTAINSRLRYYAKSPYLASAISFFIGTIFLLILTYLTLHTLTISKSVFTNNPWWIWIGGFTGAFSLTVNILLFAKLGSKQAAVLPISGQILASIVIDQFGLFDSPITKLSLLKFIGLILVLLGMLSIVDLFNFGKKDFNLEQKEPHQLSWQFLGISSGVLFAIQTATNGRLGTVLHSPIQAALITFSIGTILLIILSVITKAPILSLFNKKAHSSKLELWGWFGGIIGGINIVLIAWLAPLIGTGAVVVISLFGQLGFSILIDQLGLFKSEKILASRLQLIGVVIMLLGIVMIYFI